MASPIGHTLAGYLGYQLMPTLPIKPQSNKGLMWGAIAIANLPDLDFLPGLLVGDAFAFHRQGSHTLIAAIAVGSLVALGMGLSGKGLAGRWRKQTSGFSKFQWLWWGIWAMAVYLGHLCLDLLMADPTPPFGLQLLWPFSEAFFASPIAIIPGWQFDSMLSWHNLTVVGSEILWLMPIIWPVGAIVPKPRKSQQR
ncbi:MAG: metal-dependent hydrolase [Leptolyngbya sp. SIO1E4]|nr:metal-dependent hydrolase [Leptolyngbya sp. SIO1E4]